MCISFCVLFLGIVPTLLLFLAFCYIFTNRVFALSNTKHVCEKVCSRKGEESMKSRREEERKEEMKREERKQNIRRERWGRAARKEEKGGLKERGGEKSVWWGFGGVIFFTLQARATSDRSRHLRNWDEALQYSAEKKSLVLHNKRLFIWLSRAQKEKKTLREVIRVWLSHELVTVVVYTAVTESESLHPPVY